MVHQSFAITSLTKMALSLSVRRRLAALSLAKRTFQNSDSDLTPSTRCSALPTIHGTRRKLVAAAPVAALFRSLAAWRPSSMAVIWVALSATPETSTMSLAFVLHLGAYQHLLSWGGSHSPFLGRWLEM